ncbi:MAG: ABC transporter permease subunit [Deltaproteobacteria bacterium]|nr:ABC transporter permease subunit [Deltaproteobacteria bacterium]
MAALVWELSARAGLLDARFFPPPSEIVAEIIRLFAEENVLLDLTVSLRRIALGVAAGFVPGAVLGIVMGRASWARTTFGPLVALTYPIPKIALLPILLIIFGLGETAKIMVVAIGVFFLVVINAYAGVRRIPDVYLDVARVYRVSRAEILRRVILPACFRTCLRGCASGWATVSFSLSRRKWLRRKEDWGGVSG